MHSGSHDIITDINNVRFFLIETRRDFDFIIVVKFMIRLAFILRQTGNFTFYLADGRVIRVMGVGEDLLQILQTTVACFL